MTAATRMILVPTCLDGISSVALDAALELAPQVTAAVALLLVIEPPEHGYLGVTMTLPPDRVEELALKARTAVEELAERHGGLRVILLQGNPAEEILRAIDIFRPYLVVMGTHGRSGLSRLILGSVTERIIRMSPVPVLTVKPQPDELATGPEEADRRGADQEVDPLELTMP